MTAILSENILVLEVKKTARYCLQLQLICQFKVWRKVTCTQALTPVTQTKTHITSQKQNTEI